MSEHRRLTQEGERKSRAIQAQAQSILPGNGIIQWTTNTAVTVPWVKDLGGVPGAPKCPYTPGMKTTTLLKIFPDAVWHVCVTDVGMKSLWVGPVHFATGLAGPWRTVIHRAGLAEIFVPYHDNAAFRPFDLQWTSQLDQVTPQDAGANGSLIKLSNETVPTVVAEIRDRGVAWLCKGDTAPTGRAQELVIWGVADGGNYDNIIEYTFRDDGGMIFRTGNTGYNSPASPQEGHTHNSLWYFDMDLNGAPNDSASWLVHQEPKSSTALLNAIDLDLPIVKEGTRNWNGSINSLLVSDSALNKYGHRAGYEFTPLQHGTSRHYGPGESWTRQDVYITRYRATELGWMSVFAPPENYLIGYVNNEPTVNTDLVVWMKTAAPHHPTDEDRSWQDQGTSGTTGITLTHWSGFKVEPHNLFNYNPMGGPPRCGP